MVDGLALIRGELLASFQQSLLHEIHWPKN
jgi:hypothetical protein